MKDYFVLATKNLRHRGIRSWLTLIGILIGILSVVSLISLGASLKSAVSAQFGISSTEIISIRAGSVSGAGPPGTGVTKYLRESDVAAIEKLSGVDYAFGRIVSTQREEFNDQTNFGLVFSVPDGKKREFSYRAMDFKIEKGRFLKDSDSKKVVVGYNFYSGKEIFKKPLNVGAKIKIGGEKFEVVGILKKKGSFIWDNAIMMNEKALRKLSGYEDRVDIIVAKVKDKSQIEKTSKEIEKLMRKRRDVKKGEEDFEVSTPQAMLEKVNDVLNGVSIFIVIIASISILVGAIGIINTMTTSVLERKKEIGIMKAIGAKNSQIFLQFLIESGLLGLAGGIVGVIFGLLIGFAGNLAINSFTQGNSPLSVNPFLIAAALLASFLIGSISGIIPALNASKQNPVEALRN